MAMQRIAILCLILVSGSVHAISTTLSDAINQGSQAVESAKIRKHDALGTTDAPNAHSISVTGTVTSPDGSIAENFTVKAFAGKMGGSQLRGSALTDGGGAYTIAFPSNDSVTIIVKVYCKSTQIAASAPEYNVTEGVSIDVTVPNPKCAPGILLKQPPWPTRKAGN